MCVGHGIVACHPQASEGHVTIASGRSPRGGETSAAVARGDLAWPKCPLVSIAICISVRLIRSGLGTRGSGMVAARLSETPNPRLPVRTTMGIAKRDESPSTHRQAIIKGNESRVPAHRRYTSESVPTEILSVVHSTLAQPGRWFNRSS